MSDPRSLLVGGPLDGETIAASQQAAFVWVQPGNPHPRCYSSPAEGRSLYRLVHRIRPFKYLFAGHTHGYCQECGSFYSPVRRTGRERTALCDYCGAPQQAH